MNILIVTFFALALYGAATGQWGGAVFSTGMAAFVLVARGHFDRQDAAWAADPQRAQCPSATEQDLDAHLCECQRDRI